MNVDLKNNVAVKESIGPQNHTASINGTGVDLAPYHGAMVMFHGNNGDFTTTDEAYTPTLEESDTLGSGYTLVAAADLIGTFSDLRTTEIQTVGYKGAKQFIRAVLTLAGTTPIIDAGAVIIGSALRKAPVV